MINYDWFTFVINYIFNVIPSYLPLPNSPHAYISDCGMKICLSFWNLSRAIAINWETTNLFSILISLTFSNMKSFKITTMRTPTNIIQIIRRKYYDDCFISSYLGLLQIFFATNKHQRMFNAPLIYFLILAT